LSQNAFERGGRQGGERFSRRDITWIWQALIHGAMMSKFW
jgi:hypothetical protein